MDGAKEGIEKPLMIRLDKLDYSQTQTRAAVDEKAIDDYAQLLRDGVQLEPALVFKDNDGLYPATGKHRAEAYRKLGRREMPCIIRRGGRFGAIEAGIVDNLKHQGVRISIADKRHNIDLVLRERPE